MKMSNRKRHSLLGLTTAMLLVAGLAGGFIGCTGGGSSGGTVPTEEALRERVAGYWNLRMQGETIRRYQEYVSTAYKEGRGSEKAVTLEDYVRRVSGAAIFTGFEIKQVAIQEPDAETGEVRGHVLLAYDWHVNPEIANIVPRTKTAPLETIWLFEDGEWRRWREAKAEEAVLMN